MEVDSDTEPSSVFKEPKPASWMQTMDMGMIMQGVIQANGGLSPCSSVTERAKSSLCPELFLMSKKGDGDLMRFSDLDLTMYTRMEL